MENVTHFFAVFLPVYGHLINLLKMHLWNRVCSEKMLFIRYKVFDLYAQWMNEKKSQLNGVYQR